MTEPTEGARHLRLPVPGHSSEWEARGPEVFHHFAGHEQHIATCYSGAGATAWFWAQAFVRSRTSHREIAQGSDRPQSADSREGETMGQDQERGAGAAGTAPGPRVSDARMKQIEGFLQTGKRFNDWTDSEVGDFIRDLRDARASLERVTGELAEARREAKEDRRTATKEYDRAEAMERAVERVTQERDELVAEAKDDDAVRLMMGDILTRVTNALKGEPDARSMHDWSDLPKVAADAVRRAETAEQLVRHVIEWRDLDGNGVSEPLRLALRAALSAPAVAGAPQTPDNERPGSVPMRGPEVSGAAESAPTVSERAAAPVSTASLSAESPNTAGSGVTAFRGPSLLEQTIEEGRADIEAGRVVWGVDPTAPVSTDATPSREALLAQVAALTKAAADIALGNMDARDAAEHAWAMATGDTAAAAAEYERAIRLHRDREWCTALLVLDPRDVQRVTEAFNGLRSDRALATPTEPSRG